MLEVIRKEIKSKLKKVKEDINKKLQPYFRLYRTYIVISIVLGAAFKYCYDGFVSLIEPLLDTLHLSSTVPTGVVEINNSYLFSASAAIPATVFSIIFVLLTVFIQISDVYTSAEIFQSNETKNLMRLYFTTIVLSLMMLLTNFQFPMLALTLTIACILSLYPFLYNLTDKFVYEAGVGKLSVEIPSLIDSNNEYLAIGKIRSLVFINARCINNSRVSDFYSIMSIFDINAKKAKERKMSDAIKTIGDYYLSFLDLIPENKSVTNDRKRMINFLFRTIELYFDNYYEILSYDSLDMNAFRLKDTGLKMITNGFDDKYVNRIIETLHNTFRSIQKKRDINGDEIEQIIEESERDIVKYIGELAIDASQNKLKITFDACGIVLIRIGAEIIWSKEKSKRSNTSILFAVVEQLNKIEKISEVNYFEELFMQATNYNFIEPNFNKYVNEFKKEYQLRKSISFNTINT